MQKTRMKHAAKRVLLAWLPWLPLEYIALYATAYGHSEYEWFTDV
jgi:hypothetical protein